MTLEMNDNLFDLLDDDTILVEDTDVETAVEVTDTTETETDADGDDGWEQIDTSQFRPAMKIALNSKPEVYSANYMENPIVVAEWNARTEQDKADLLASYHDLPETREALRGTVIPFSECRQIRGINTGDTAFATKQQKNADRIGAGFPVHIKQMIAGVEEHTIEQEQAIFQNICEVRALREDDPEADDIYMDMRSDMALANIKVAVWAARNYKWAASRNPLVEIDDLFQSAWEGIIYAVNDWDPDRGKNTRFGALALVMANTTVKRFISANGTHSKAYRLPKKRALLAGAINRWTDELMQELDRRPTVHELWSHAQNQWEFTNCKGLKMQEFQQLVNIPKTTSLDDDEDGYARSERFICEEPDNYVEELVDTMLNCSGLTERERTCVEARFHFHTESREEAIGERLLSYRKVARIAGITHKVAQQYVDSALAKMKANSINIARIVEGTLEVPSTVTDHQLNVRNWMLGMAKHEVKREERHHPKTATEPVVRDEDGNTMTEADIVAKQVTKKAKNEKPEVPVKLGTHQERASAMLDAFLM